MKNLTKLLCIGILLTLSVGAFAQYGYSSRYNDYQGIIGSVLSIDKNDRAFQLVDRSGSRYTVYAKSARFYEGEKKREFKDIKVGSFVEIDGRETGRSGIEARTVYMLRADQRYQGYRGTFRLSGTIRSIDVRRTKIEMTDNGKTQTIRTNNQTVILSPTGHRIEIGNLKKGDEITVEAFLSTDNEIVAETLRQGGGYGWPDGRYSNTIEGRVTRTPSRLDRKLRVEMRGWSSGRGESIEVDVPKDARVMRRGRSISVHEIQTGETVYMEGTWSRSEFRPVRIEVGDTASWRDLGRTASTMQGRIQQIDYRNRELVIDTVGGERRVYCDRARIYDGGRERRFEDLRRGDRVQIKGNISRSTIDAERIDAGGLTSRW